MSLHQKRVTITAVDLSKVSENCCVVLNVPADAILAPAELDKIGLAIQSKVPKGTPMIVLPEGQTLTVEQLPKHPEIQKVDDFLKSEGAIPSGGHTPVDEVLGLLRVARLQRDMAESENRKPAVQKGRRKTKKK